jgi:type I restriction enzyme S subunit
VRPLATGTQRPTNAAWLNDLPPHWEVRKLKFIAEITTSGVWGDDPDTESSGERVATTADLDMLGNIDVEGMTIRKLTDQERVKGLCQPGDIIVVKSSGSATNVISGKAAIVKKEHGPIYFNNFTLRVRPSSVLDPRFLWFFLTSDVVRRQILLMVSTTTYPNLQVEEYASFLVPIPDIDDQRSIAEFLQKETAHTDALRQSNENLLLLLDEKRQSIITSAVTGGVTANTHFQMTGIEWLEQIPAHWEVKRAKRLFREIDERSETGEETLLSLRMERGLVPHNDVSKKPIPAENLIGYKIARAGEIVLNRMRAASGLVAVAPQHGIVSPDYAVFRALDGVNPDYFTLLFKTPLLQAVFRSLSSGLGTGESGFLRLYSEDFLNVKIPVPPFDEQKAIVSELAGQQRRTAKVEEALESSIKLLKERRAALITAAVTGQIEPEVMSA